MIRRQIELESRWFHWLCGLLEGEGSYARATPSAPRRPRIAICMTDRQIIERVAELIGARVYIHKLTRASQLAFRTELVGGSAVALMRLLRPQMSQRRQGQIDAAMATFQPLRPSSHKTFSLLPGGAQEAERYWLAGYLEGAAYFGRKKRRHLRSSPLVEINTPDLDVAQHVRALWYRRYGVNSVMDTRRSRRAGYHAHHTLRAMGLEAWMIISDIYMLLGERRQAQIDDLLGGEWQQQERLREQGTPLYGGLPVARRRQSIASSQRPLYSLGFSRL